MSAIMTNTWRIFKRNKEMFYLITIQPVLIFLLMSFLLPYTTAHNVAVVNLSEDTQVEQALERMEGINLVDTELDTITEKLIGGNIELAVIINTDESVELRGFGNSEIEKAVELCVEKSDTDVSGSKNVQVNQIAKKGMTVSNSLGFMIFKTLTAGNLLAALLIEERKRKMKDRIFLSGVKTVSYIGAMSLVYLAFMALGSVVYYLAALIMNFDFGMKNSIGFLLMLFMANILSVCLYLFASTLVSKEDSLWFVGSFILLPMALFSGVLFPYQFMPKAMQAIGACFPQRWINDGIEIMQKTGRIGSSLPQIAKVLLLSALLFLGAVYRSRPRTSIKK